MCTRLLYLIFMFNPRIVNGFVVLWHDMHLQRERTHKTTVKWLHRGHTQQPTSRSKQGTKEVLASGTRGFWLLRLLRFDAFLFDEFVSTNGLRVRVEAEENPLVGQWILVLSPRAFSNLRAGRSDDSLDHGTVDDSSDIRVANLGSRESEVFLVNRGFIEGAKDLVEETKSTLGPDNESAKVTTGCKLE